MLTPELNLIALVAVAVVLADVKELPPITPLLLAEVATVVVALEEYGHTPPS